MMRRAHKTVFATLLAGLVLTSSSCGDAGIFGCEYSLLSTEVSPSEKFKAAVVRVGCGATTEEAEWVLLAPAEQPFDYDEHQVAVFQGGEVSIVWVGDVLEVAHSELAFRNDKTSLGVTIRYLNIK